MGNYALRHDNAAVPIRTLTTEKKDIERKTNGFIDIYYHIVLRNNRNKV